MVRVARLELRKCNLLGVKPQYFVSFLTILQFYYTIPSPLVLSDFKLVRESLRENFEVPHGRSHKSLKSKHFLRLLKRSFLKYYFRIAYKNRDM